MAVQDEEDDLKPVAGADAPAEGAEAVTSLDDDEGAAKKAKLKKILLIVVPIVLLLGGGAGLYFTGTLDKLLGKKPAAEATAVAEAVVEKPVFFEVQDLLVNLNPGTNGAQRYLKLKIKLQLDKEADLAKVEAVAPRVVDQFQTFLREIRIDDLRGSAGIYRLRQELLYRVNIAARPVVVKDVLFQEILVQ